METAMSLVRRLTRLGLMFGGALVLLAAVLIAVDVVLRAVFAKSIGGADELAGYALAIGTAWGLGAALVDRAHVRIDSLYILFPTRLRLALDFTALLLFAAFFGLVGWHGSGVVQQSWTAATRSQSALETPTVVPQALWMIGLIGFVLVSIVLLAHSFRMALAGNLGSVAQAIGTRSAEEEVEDEIRAFEKRQIDRGAR